MFRGSSLLPATRLKVDLPEINFIGIRVERDTGRFINIPLKDSKLREQTGVNIVAIRRGEQTITELSGDQKLKLGDIVYVVGRPQNLEILTNKLEVT